MANPRPESVLIPSDMFDESNSSKRKSKKVHESSSSSSTDSTSGKNVNINEKNSPPQNLHTTSSTTSDSDFESEQDDSLQSQQRSKSDSNSSEHLTRRVKHFHKLFQSEIGDEMPDLIDTYVCAYQGDILLQGKMYITDRYLCFHSRIINYVTKHVYRWEDIDNVTKERVAFIFPTAIGIQSKQTGKKVTYASFLLRDQAFDKIVSIWSKFSNGNHSCEDNDDEIAQDGTLKATNSNERNRYLPRESYDIIDEPEQEVLQMCFEPNQKRSCSTHRKGSDEKQSSKKLEKKSSSSKTSNQDQKLTNGTKTTDSSLRNSRYTKNEPKTNDKKIRKIFI